MSANGDNDSAVAANKALGPPTIEIKKSPLVERRKIPGYQMTESEDQISSDVQALARELQRAVSMDAPRSPTLKKAPAPEIQVGSASAAAPQSPRSHTVRFLAVSDPHATVHSDLSDYEHSDMEDDEPHPEARRRMSMTEKAQLEDMMRHADYHHENTKDVGLMHDWAFWIDKNVKKGVSEESFLDSLHKLGTFNTSHGFSELLLMYADELINIHQHSEKCNIRLFRDGVTPTREDPKNINGGQYVVFLPRDRLEVKRLWLDAMISVISERMQLKGDVTGVVLALKKRADTIAIWTDRGCHPSLYSAQKEHICEVLGLPGNTKIKYNNHNTGKKQASGQNSPYASPAVSRAHGSPSVAPLSPMTRRTNNSDSVLASPMRQPMGVEDGGSWRSRPDTHNAPAQGTDMWQRDVPKSPSSPRRLSDKDISRAGNASPRTHRSHASEDMARSPATARTGYANDGARSPRLARSNGVPRYDDFASQYGQRSPAAPQRQPGNMQPLSPRSPRPNDRFGQKQ